MKELEAARLHAARLLGDLIDAVAPPNADDTSVNDTLHVIDAIAKYTQLNTYHAIQSEAQAQLEKP